MTRKMAMGDNSLPVNDCPTCHGSGVHPTSPEFTCPNCGGSKTAPAMQSGDSAAGHSAFDEGAAPGDATPWDY